MKKVRVELCTYGHANTSISFCCCICSKTFSIEKIHYTVGNLGHITCSEECTQMYILQNL
jgi:hypothetical protein